MSEEYDGGTWHHSLQANPHGAQHCEMPCVHCGTLTTRRAVTGMQILVPHAGQNIYAPELMAWCEACAKRRHLEQAHATANNPAVLPHIRDQVLAFIRENGRAK